MSIASQNVVHRLVPIARAETQEPAILGKADRALINWLRVVARGMQACGRIDLDRACQLIAVETTVAADRYAVALLKAASDFARSPVRIYQVGSMEHSHFELWFARLIRCLQNSDEASVRMLIGSFIDHSGQRRVAFLAAGLADVIDQEI